MCLVAFIHSRTLAFRARSFTPPYPFSLPFFLVASRLSPSYPPLPSFLLSSPRILLFIHSSTRLSCVLHPILFRLLPTFPSLSSSPTFLFFLTFLFLVSLATAFFSSFLLCLEFLLCSFPLFLDRFFLEFIQFEFRRTSFHLRESLLLLPPPSIPRAFVKETQVLRDSCTRAIIGYVELRVRGTRARNVTGTLLPVDGRPAPETSGALITFRHSGPIVAADKSSGLYRWRLVL